MVLLLNAQPVQRVALMLCGTCDVGIVTAAVKRKDLPSLPRQNKERRHSGTSTGAWQYKEYRPIVVSKEGGWADCREVGPAPGPSLLPSGLRLALGRPAQRLALHGPHRGAHGLAHALPCCRGAGLRCLEDARLRGRVLARRQVWA